MHFAEVSVPGVPTKSSQVLFRSVWRAFTTKRRQRRVVREVRGVGGVEISLCIGVPELIVALDAAPKLYMVVLCTIVGSLLSRLPSLDFGNHVPHRCRYEVDVSQE